MTITLPTQPNFNDFFTKRKKTLVEKTFMIELDPLQLSSLHYMDCLSYTKKEHSCRPILASNSSYTYECATWLNEILAPQREHPANIKDTFDVVSTLSKINLSLSHMTLLDVIGLITNIPLDFAIYLVLLKIYSDSGVTLFHGLNKTQLEKLLISTTKHITLKF